MIRHQNARGPQGLDRTRAAVRESQKGVTGAKRRMGFLGPVFRGEWGFAFRGFDWLQRGPVSKRDFVRVGRGFVGFFARMT